MFVHEQEGRKIRKGKAGRLKVSITTICWKQLRMLKWICCFHVDNIFFSSERNNHKSCWCKTIKTNEKRKVSDNNGNHQDSNSRVKCEGKLLKRHNRSRGGECSPQAAEQERLHGDSWQSCGWEAHPVLLAVKQTTRNPPLQHPLYKKNNPKHSL